MRIKLSIISCFIMLLLSCTNDERNYPEDSASIQLLKSLSSNSTGLDFNNKLVENSTTNAITFDGMLQGAGVGVLDANNDGLQDIIFASNQDGDQLYINKGNLKFENQTSQYGIGKYNWTTGVSIVDINNDGYDDIYLCKFLYNEHERRRNVFYINDGNGKFVNRAREMGLDDPGFSIMANFFDFDRDGDLDVYIANQPPNALRSKTELKGKVNYGYSDRLYMNDGGKFSDITDIAGLTNYTYSLSATTIDYNKDGWIDLYIACDYDEADFIYKNNGDGTFTNVANDALKHMSNFSMGVDVADINNDGNLDVYVADMVAEDNFRQKTNMSGMNPAKFYALAEAGYHYQYMFNALQLNNGDGSFSEIAQMSGVSNTDWSWAPLFIDFDQDGYKDLMVTNGLIKDMRNKDFEIWIGEYMAQARANAQKTPNKTFYVDLMELSNRAPSFKISNYVYRNKGDLTFEKMNNDWGFNESTWSQGAAYADFDNDGDLDLVINNMNMEAGFYQNMANENNVFNSILIDLEGPALNKKGIGAIIEVFTGEQKQVYELTPYRGYMSTCEPVAHFGLGTSETIDKINVIWPDNKMNELINVSVNQELTIKYSEANKTKVRKGGENKLFSKSKVNDIVHVENNYDDFAREVLLPYKTSTLGPALATGDVNNDGLNDLFLGGSMGQAGQILVNNGNGGFNSTSQKTLEIDKGHEDGGAVFFDSDGDGDLDLYVCSGGSEFRKDSEAYEDRLYINDGSGQFARALALPKINISTGSAVALDIDSDNDLDLFIGGRQIPGEYGKNTRSYILENKGNQFVEYKKNGHAFLSDYGMVTDLATSDLDGDGREELIVVGEWMPVSIYSVVEGVLKDNSEKFGISNSKGWWNCVELADVDNDGDNDLIAGNLGLNLKYKASIEEPFKLFVDDFDGNGTNDVYLGYYQDGECYPVRGRQCSSEQMPFVKEKFKNYEDFGIATIDMVLENRVKETTTVQEAQTFANTVFINDNGSFKAVELPNEAQISPVYGIAVDDFDKNGSNEIFLAGNMYNREVETTRSDAGKGCLISFDANGNISVQRTDQTGVSADKDVRDVAIINSGNQSLLLIANNDDAMQIYRY